MNENMSVLKSRLRRLQNRQYALLEEYSEATARMSEYSTRRRIRPGEKMEALVLRRMRAMKKNALAACQENIRQLERQLDLSV